LKTINDKYPEA